MPPGGIAEQPVSPPIWLTSDYLYEGLEHYADVINERRPGYVYGRYGNPTHVALHRVLASLDGAESAWSFASGMAAIHTSLTSLLADGQLTMSLGAFEGFPTFSRNFTLGATSTLTVTVDGDAPASTPVPEPATLGLVGFGLLALTRRVRRPGPRAGGSR